MSALWIFLAVVAIGISGFVLGRQKAIMSVAGQHNELHSRPVYYGFNVLIASMLPALLVFIVWLIAQPVLVSSMVSGHIPDSAIPESQNRSIVMSDVIRLANGLDKAVSEGAFTREEAARLNPDTTNIRELLGQSGIALGSDVRPEVMTAALEYRTLSRTGYFCLALVAIGLALAGLVYSLMRTKSDFRARNRVEKVVLYMLVSAALVAILTTIGIVLSLIFNTIEFFRIYPASKFFFGTTWSPHFGGGSDLGIAPLLWGTLYISFLALAVAVPVGLMTAIYLSEYANSKVRSIVKPAIEVLAGIPTIVYGLFALLTVGPLLLDAFGRDGTGWMQASTAVITAGLALGIRLIPFVSSLSDDIINAVPQSLRDGSYGLGATQSETVKQVILPAALPGIVGAILLAASRAIGETMIVVMGAGAAARMSLNPFEAMTTVTVKIVSQLTGDADFASPEALVAFALGMTLFIITLGLNIVALYIVRKYREQYE